MQFVYALFSGKWMDTLTKKYLTLVPTSESREKIKMWKCKKDMTKYRVISEN